VSLILHLNSSISIGRIPFIQYTQSMVVIWIPNTQTTLKITLLNFLSSISSTSVSLESGTRELWTLGGIISPVFSCFLYFYVEICIYIVINISCFYVMTFIGSGFLPNDVLWGIILMCNASSFPIRHHSVISLWLLWFKFIGLGIEYTISESEKPTVSRGLERVGALW
jgi:hypothetical protein